MAIISINTPYLHQKHIILANFYNTIQVGISPKKTILKKLNFGQILCFSCRYASIRCVLSYLQHIKWILSIDMEMIWKYPFPIVILNLHMSLDLHHQGRSEHGTTRYGMHKGLSIIYIFGRFYWGWFRGHLLQFLVFYYV